MAFVRRATSSCLALCAALWACGESLSPASVPPMLTFGDAESVDLGATDAPSTYRLAVAADSVYAVSIQATLGIARVSVRTDTVATATAALLAVSVSSDSTLQIYDIHPAAAGTVFVQLRSDRSGQAVSLSVRVDRVPVGPEHAAAAIAGRALVTSELLDDPADVDRFTYTATTAGQIQPVVGAAAGMASGSGICLAVTDSTGHLLGYTDAYTPDTTLHGIASGALTIGPGTYRIEIGSLRNECRFNTAADLPYVGPYRLQVFPVDTAPETAASAYVLGDTVRGEAVDYPGDVDVFTLSGAPGATINLLLSSLGGDGAASSTQLDVLDANGSLIAHAVSNPTNPGLLPASTGNAVMPASGVVTLRVSGMRVGIGTSQGPYELVTNAVDVAPEHVPALITVGDTISGEAIDAVGDIDDFAFQGDSGQIYTAILQATGSADDHLQLTVDRPGTPDVSALASSTDGDATLMPPGSPLQLTPRFTLPASGAYRIRVRGASDRAIADVGPYRFLIYPINAAPETAAPSFQLGDSIMDEAIDLPNDVDTFTVSVPDSMGGALLITLRDYYVFAPVTLTGARDTFLIAFNGGPIRDSLAPGTYTLHIPSARHSPYVAPYQVHSWGFSWSPEHIGDTVAVGDTVRGEWPDNALDVDRFLVYGGARAHLNVLLARGSQGSPLVGSLRQPGAWYPLRSVGSGSDTLGVDQSGRIDLPASGWYTFDVQVAGDWLGTDSLSPYTFLIEPVNTTPEHVPATITFGDTVTSETIDFPGDYDEFQLTATPGQVVDATLAVGKIQYGTFALQAYDSTTATIIGSVTVGASTARSVQFTVPTSGRVTLSVAQPFAPGIYYDAVGTYRLWVQPAASQ